VRREGEVGFKAKGISWIKTNKNLRKKKIERELNSRRSNLPFCLDWKGMNTLTLLRLFALGLRLDPGCCREL
jgi:hypothetical protein